MVETEQYRRMLAGARNGKELEAVLKEHSGLPGPRGNLELAHVFARMGQPEAIWRFARLEPNDAPENTPEGYLAFCGVLGLGRLVLDGDAAAEKLLRVRASDPRWRVREGVATAVQLIGDVDRRRFTRIATTLAKGNALEQRAAVAAVAEPRLLEGEAVTVALELLDDVTRGIERSKKPLGDAEKVLRQALGYAWSVVVAADPAQGKPVMERWFGRADPDIGWAMRENLKKKRLLKADPSWCARWTGAIAAATAGVARRKARAAPSRARPAVRRRAPRARRATPSAVCRWFRLARARRGSCSPTSGPLPTR